MADTWQIAVLLPRFYAKNAQAIGGKAPFTIKSFDFGHDPALVDSNTTPPTLKPYDGSRNDTPNKFFGADFAADDVVYTTDGRLLFKCRMPENTLKEPAEYSLTVLRDNDGDAVAVSVDLPDWVIPTEGVETHPYINFPSGGEDSGK